VSPQPNQPVQQQPAEAAAPDPAMEENKRVARQKVVDRFAAALDLTPRDREHASRMASQLLCAGSQMTQFSARVGVLDEPPLVFKAAFAIAMKSVEVCEDDPDSPPLKWRTEPPAPPARTLRDRRDLAVCVIRQAVVLSFALLWERVKGALTR
jgi:hypothetical protein